MIFSVFYFAGLIMVGISIGSHWQTPEYGFFTIGGGLIIYSLGAWFMKFMRPTSV